MRVSKYESTLADLIFTIRAASQQKFTGFAVFYNNISVLTKELMPYISRKHTITEVKPEKLRHTVLFK